MRQSHLNRRSKSTAGARNTGFAPAHWEIYWFLVQCIVWSVSWTPRPSARDIYIMTHNVSLRNYLGNVAPVIGLWPRRKQEKPILTAWATFAVCDVTCQPWTNCFATDTVVQELVVQQTFVIVQHKSTTDVEQWIKRNSIFETNLQHKGNKHVLDKCFTRWKIFPYKYNNLKAKAIQDTTDLPSVCPKQRPLSERFLASLCRYTGTVICTPVGKISPKSAATPAPLLVWGRWT
jgi:hypothetical protein